MLISFDRLFGTSRRAARGALALWAQGTGGGHNPFSIALGEWRRLLADVGHVRGLTAKLKTLFGAP